MFLVVTCQHASGMCQSHSCPLLSLHEVSRKYIEGSPNTPPFLTLRFHEKDLTPTPNLLQIRPILPPLGHILSTQQVASVACGGRGSGNHPRRHDQGQGPQTSDKCQKGLVPQSEVDKQTHIVNRHYSDAKLDHLTPAEKQKLWQLRNVGKTPGTGLTRRDRRRAVSLILNSSTSSGGSSKRQMEDPVIKGD